MTTGEGNKKCGNRYLAWAFSEAVQFAVRYNERALTILRPQGGKKKTQSYGRDIVRRLSRLDLSFGGTVSILQTRDCSPRDELRPGIVRLHPRIPLSVEPASLLQDGRTAQKKGSSS